MKQIISREEAVAAGLERYFTGHECQNGHVDDRSTKTKKCVECDRLRRKRYYERHPGRDQARAKRWRENNREEWLASAHRSYVKRYARSGSIKLSLRKKIAAEQDHECAVCKADLRSGFHIDHRLTLSKGGTSERENLWALCPPCNLSKADRDLVAWLQERAA